MKLITSLMYLCCVHHNDAEAGVIDLFSKKSCMHPSHLQKDDPTKPGTEKIGAVSNSSHVLYPEEVH